ncbi:recombinase [Youngiibacter fragilis 232.1]|uniref:Recombinase n=1 Tax=Youngiibacter fragilis 232.1 TaxID=994573 RepID=V7I671_9CLOT|nr:recombinase [Youngiibacter fragilis 232.1]
MGIKSPTGKATWPKRSIDVMLSNEKYMGNVRVLDNGKYESYYRVENNNPAIISKETFQAVQIEKQQRSNVIESEEGNKRKNKKYSSKQ